MARVKRPNNCTETIAHSLLLLRKVSCVSHQKMKYNQTAVDAIERFEKTVESLQLDPTTAVQLGSILNSVEVQV